MWILAPEEFYKLLYCHLGLGDDGFDCLWRQVSAVPWYHNVKMRLGRVPQVRMTACLMVDKEPGSQQSL